MTKIPPATSPEIRETERLRARAENAEARAEELADKLRAARVKLRGARAEIRALRGENEELADGNEQLAQHGREVGDLLARVQESAEAGWTIARRFAAQLGLADDFAPDEVRELEATAALVVAQQPIVVPSEAPTPATAPTVGPPSVAEAATRHADALLANLRRQDAN
jgi:hypothetical protein